MAKADKNENTGDSIDEFPLTIDEFCASQSQTDRRVELLGAFHSQEKQAGRVKDKRSAYLQRYNDFANAPA
jgi:pyrroloquinoline quinone (PQQ) biosynthesis protein C